MALSQNGYTGITEYGDSRLWVNPVVPGSNGVKILGGVLSGDVATVLLNVARLFNASVETLDAGACWGFQPRDIRGSATLSNHASGTAIDLNAPRHGLGASGTFNAAQVRAIRAILNAHSGVVRWGGDYSGRKDEMHFEIVGSSRDIAAVAAAIRTQGTMPTPAPAPAPAPSPAPKPAPTSAPTPAPMEDDEDMYRTVQNNGRWFAAAPGRFFHIENQDHHAVGVANGLFPAGDPKPIGAYELDILRDVCLGNGADKDVNITDKLPSDVAQGK